MDVETRRIPRRMKETGFRWGIAFDNPSGEDVSWYEVVRLPARLKQLSGDLGKVTPTEVKSEVNHSSERHIVDQFWFDAGDPTGLHKLELYINNRRRCTIAFEVVPAE